MEGNEEEGHFEYGGYIPDSNEIRSYNPFMDRQGQKIDFSRYLLMNNYDKPKPKSEENIEKRLADLLKDTGDEKKEEPVVKTEKQQREDKFWKAFKGEG